MATTLRRKLLGSVERALLGMVFAFVAFIIERKVLRSIKEGAVSKGGKKTGLTAVKAQDGLVLAPNEIDE